MFKRSKKVKKDKIKENKFNRRKSNTPKLRENKGDKTLLPTEPVPEYLPVLTSNITDITPDELMFAYSWAKYPNNPTKALNECGVQIPGKKKGDVLKELISSKAVQKAFREGLINRIQSLKATQDKSRRYLSCMAYLDKGESLDEKGHLLNLKDMPFHVRVCIQEYEEKQVTPVKGAPYTIRKVKFTDSKDALKILMQESGSAGKEMNKLLGSNNTFIQNITNTNIIGSGNTYNTLIQNRLDLSRLNVQEMDILFKALGIDADQGAVQAQGIVQEIIDVPEKDIKEVV